MHNRELPTNSENSNRGFPKKLIAFAASILAVLSPMSSSEASPVGINTPQSTAQQNVPFDDSTVQGGPDNTSSTGTRKSDTDNSLENTL